MTKQRRYPRAGRAFTVGMLALLLAACGVEATTPEPPALGADASAEEILARARDAMAEVDSYRFDVTVESSSSEPVELSGEWTAPNNWRLTGAENTEVRWVGGLIYARDVHSRSGAGLDTPIPADRYPGFTPQAPVLDLADAEVISGAGSGDASSGRATVIRGTGKFGRAGVDATIEVRVDGTIGRVLTMTVEPLGSCGVEFTFVSGTSVSRELVCDTVISYRYFDYDEPITIEVPEGFE